MIKERLKVFLERQGVVLPDKPEEVAEVLKEHELLRDEILLWATLHFGLPFSDLDAINLNQIEECTTKYGVRLKEARTLLGGEAK